MPTLKQIPSDADIVSQKLMLRAGLIRKLSAGIYEWLPAGYRILKKVEQIIREEMGAISGQELWLPAIQPKELWLESGRWNIYGKELYRIKDRSDREFCLGPTHEEIITDIVRKEVRSYRQLPVMLYQFQTKFRDEIRPRFGVMRAKEFYMKDAYSFHATDDDAERYYEEVVKAYKKICERCGLKYRIVEASAGAIGGSFSHEFMVLADTGEEELAVCNCGYGANLEKAACLREENSSSDSLPEMKAMEEVHTPNFKTVDEVSKFFGEKPSKFIKSLMYLADGKPVMALVRGDYEINDEKLKNRLNAAELVLADAATIEKIAGTPAGFLSPITGKKSGIPVHADYSVEHLVNAISGANKKDYHIKNINIHRDYTPDSISDLRNAAHGDKCPVCRREQLKFIRGIEIGHTFKLGTKYSSAMNAVFLDEKGERKNFIMGCYGIGVSRIVAAAIEQSYDNNGIIWPENIAPFKAVIIPVSDSIPVKQESMKIYELLSSKYDVLLDDRNERAGVKFKDADLIGIPWRITVSDKTIEKGGVEIKNRASQSAQIVEYDKILDFIK